MMTQKDKRVKVSAKIHFVTERVGYLPYFNSRSLQTITLYTIGMKRSLFSITVSIYSNQ